MDETPTQHPAPAVASDRQVLAAAHARGSVSTVLAYFRLSGPGWLQSAITLGGGSLTGALFLGVLGGYSMLWLQLISILMGVIMLSAISYVTLSSRLRPFQAINQYINPILGCAWLLATVMANVIWCMPQFSLCYDAINKGLLNSQLEAVAAPQGSDQATKVVASEAESSSLNADGPSSNADGPSSNADGSNLNADGSMFDAAGTLTLPWGNPPASVDFFWAKISVSSVILVLAFTMVFMNASGGWAAWWFDVLLKIIIGIIVLCFFGTVIYLSSEGKLPWEEIWQGFIPNFNQWNTPSAQLSKLLGELPVQLQEYWRKEIITQQRSVMISTVATAVGINMTFLLPYSLLARGWDRTFRGLARFDLVFGMMIPFVLVTSCVVIASAAAFHAQADAGFLSSDPAQIASSPLFPKSRDLITNAYTEKLGDDFNQLAGPEQSQRLAETIAGLSQAERRIVSSLAKRDSFDLSQTLAPLFEPSAKVENDPSGSGENSEPVDPVQKGDDTTRAGSAPVLLWGLTGRQVSSLVFSVGALAMGFSTIIILMLINGYAIAELFQVPANTKTFLAGALIPGIAGAAWPFIWQGESKLWLAISAGTFGFLLLPIAYFSFLLLINSSAVLGENRPRGISRWVWNILLTVSLLVTIIAAGAALIEKVSTDQQYGGMILGAIVCFIALAVIGFFATHRQAPPIDHDLL